MGTFRRTSVLTLLSVLLLPLPASAGGPSPAAPYQTQAQAGGPAAAAPWPDSSFIDGRAVSAISSAPS